MKKHTEHDNPFGAIINIFLNDFSQNQRAQSVEALLKTFVDAVRAEERLNTLEQFLLIQKGAKDPQQFLQGIIRWLGADLRVDRIGIFETTESEDQARFLFGIGPGLPVHGEQIEFPKGVKEKLKHQNIARNPTAGIGFDCYLKITQQAFGIILALDDTRNEREFTNFDVEHFQRMGKMILMMLTQKLESDIDPLMRILNRRKGEQQLQEAVSYFQKHPLPKQLVVMLIDIDHFKQVNDTFGHQAGDEVLRTIGNVCQAMVKSEAKCQLVSRYGGEEILVVHTDPAAAEKLRRAIETAETFYSQQFIKVTASVGYVVIKNKKGVIDTHSLLASADRALYQAKNTGRNRAVSGKI